MKEKVYIKVKGLQTVVDYAGGEDEPDEIEVINVGSYSIVNGKEYVKYDEVYEGTNDKCVNIIKIDKNHVEITKKGYVTAHLSFLEGEKTMTCYDTPFGNIYLGVFARKIDIHRTENEITVGIDYALELNYEQVSDCHVDVEIRSKEGKFTLLS